MRQKVGCVPHTKEFFDVPEKLVTQRDNSSCQLLVAYDNQQNLDIFLTPQISLITSPGTEKLH